MMQRRLIANFDLWLLVLLLALAGAGVLNLYSAAASSDQAGAAIYLRQLTWFGLGLVVMLVVALVGYQRLVSLAWPIYMVVVAGLLAVLLTGRVVGGSQRWLALGPVVLQPSELARLAVILVLANHFSRRDLNQPYTIRQLIPTLLITAVPAALILKQPDLGTALLLVIVALSMALINGVRLSSLGLAAGTLLLVLPVGWNFLKEYQKRRIFSFLNPEADPLGAAYHVIQSKIAVGSGQLAGKGFLAGTQSQLHFLPEQHTDFAFSVLAEEWGFIGASLVLILLGALVFRGIYTAWKSKDRMGMLVVGGATACLFWPAVINVGMVLGLFPVVGIPLPFISYGGSSMLTNMAAIGLIQAVNMQRFIFIRQ